MTKRRKRQRKQVSSKYSGAVDDYQPGSRKKVLRNKLGITKVKVMHDVEIEEYARATEELSRNFDAGHTFTEGDIKDIHRSIFGRVYEWAGEYRSVDMSKDGFVFARAILIPQLMPDFVEGYLIPYTPFRSGIARGELVARLAAIHVEFILIHPFREGNGRTVRLFLSLLAQQAGYEGLDFSFIGQSGKEYNEYIAAIQNGGPVDYSAMERIIDRALP